MNSWLLCRLRSWSTWRLLQKDNSKLLELVASRLHNILIKVVSQAKQAMKKTINTNLRYMLHILHIPCSRSLCVPQIFAVCPLPTFTTLALHMRPPSHLAMHVVTYLQTCMWLHINALCQRFYAQISNFEQLSIFEQLWACLSMFEHFWAILRLFEQNWAKLSKVSEQFWADLSIFGQIWADLSKAPEQFWAQSLSHFECTWGYETTLHGYRWV